MSSTLSTLRKTVHRGLHERSIHYLSDTGTAREILNFSKQNRSSLKVHEVVKYLYSFLGINIYQENLKPRTKVCSQPVNRSKGHVSRLPGSTYNLSENSGSSRIFEIKKLIESVAQELAYLFSLTEENSHSTQYSWKVSRYHMTSVKKQKLACCSYPSCLFNVRKQIWSKEQKVCRKKNKKLVTRIKNDTRKSVPRYRTAGRVQETIVQRRAANMSKNITAKKEKKPQSNYLIPKSTVEIATQTTFGKGNVFSYSSSYQDTLRRVCDEEDSSNSEEEYYCKSDTLNDASMITEEIASEFDVDHHPPSKFETNSKILNIAAAQNGGLRSKSNTSSNLRIQKDIKPEGSDVSRSNVNSVKYTKCASEKRKSFSSCKGIVNKQLSVISPVSRTLNVSSRSNTCKSNINVRRATEKAFKEVDTSQRTHSKCNSSKKEKQNEHSLTNRQEKCNDSTGKEHDQESFKEPGCNVLQEQHNSRKEVLHSKEEVAEDKVEVSLDILDLEKEFDIEEVNTLSKIFNKFDENAEKEQINGCLPVASSSDNETTYLPVVSSSDNVSDREENSNGSSSIKENDNISPEYSSHWTEEDSSTEVSESEMDESFKKKFITYKRFLLEDDDGVAASSEGGTLSSKESDNIEDAPIFSNGVTFTRREILSDLICIENINEFRKRLQIESNLLQSVDEAGWNMLHLAASKGLDVIVKELLDNGMHVESTTLDGYTPLKLAVTHNRLNCCKVLLQNGSSLIKNDGTFDEGILEAAENSATSPMKRLLKKYEENLGRLRMISDVLNHFGEKKKNISTILSKTLLQSLADLTLEEESEILLSSSVPSK